MQKKIYFLFISERKVSSVKPKLPNNLVFFSLIRNFANDMKISNRMTNMILALMAGILALLCVLSIVQH